jgi:hypothetical protein
LHFFQGTERIRHAVIERWSTALPNRTAPGSPERFTVHGPKILRLEPVWEKEQFVFYARSSVAVMMARALLPAAASAAIAGATRWAVIAWS